MAESQYSDYLFISYAWDDAFLAEWLEKKLTIAGYRVWRDVTQMPGGQSIAADIDDAIKTKSFRMIALLSGPSLAKPSPIKERQLALNLSRERQVDFIIPVNASVSPAELPWNLSDLAFVDFRTNWAQGFNTLLDALVKAEAPRPLPRGSELINDPQSSSGIFHQGTEPLVSNLFPVTSIPSRLYEFKTAFRTTGRKWDNLRQQCPFRNTGRYQAITFDYETASDLEGLTFRQSYNLSQHDDVHGIPINDVLKPLIENSLRVAALNRGMAVEKNGAKLHVPSRIWSGTRHSFIDADGQRNQISLGGSKTFFVAGKDKEKYSYHLSPLFHIRNDIEDKFLVQVLPRVHVTTTEGRQLPTKNVKSRVKDATRDWWNKHWRQRCLALMQFIAHGEDEIVVGSEIYGSVSVASSPLTFDSPRSLADATIRQRRDRRKKRPQSEEVGDAN